MKTTREDLALSGLNQLFREAKMIFRQRSQEEIILLPFQRCIAANLERVLRIKILRFHLALSAFHFKTDSKLSLLHLLRNKERVNF